LASIPLGAAEGMYMKIQPETARAGIMSVQRASQGRVKGQAYHTSYLYRPS
jgi:hypothetical protein